MLDINRVAHSTGSPAFTTGPNTPPPASGNWTVDQPGNYVDNATIILGGDLLITSGELALDNVTLIMNCTSDGQYRIYVGPGGTFNLANSNITALNGSLHYRFLVLGKMVMERCSISEMWGSTVYWWEGGGIVVNSTNTTIRSCAISDGQTQGVEVQKNASARIDDCSIFGNGADGISVENSSCPLIANCTLQNNNFNGIHIVDASAPSIMNCTFVGNRQDGITVAGSAHPAITDSISSGNVWCGIAIYGNSTPVLTGCDFVNNSQLGMGVIDTAKPSSTDCRFSGNEWSGINTELNSAPDFTGCTIENNSRNGVWSMENAQPVFRDCIFAHNNFSGIYIDGSSAPSFSGCNASGNSAIGAQIMESARPTFDNCSMSKNMFYGMLSANDAQPLVKNCLAAGNNWSGFGAHDTSTATYEGCVAASNSQHGIVFGSTGLSTVSNCTSKENFGSGFTTVLAARPAFSGCAAKNNWQHGLDIAGTSVPSFTDCVSSFNMWDGIAIGFYSNPALVNCSAVNNTCYGMNINGYAKPIVKNCVCGGNGWSGVYVAGSSNAQISECSAMGNRESGFIMNDSARPRASDCIATGNHLDGMAACGDAKPIFENCTSTGNYAAGFGTYESSAAEFSDSSTNDNLKEGISTYDESTPVFKNCTAEGNRLAGMVAYGHSSPVFDGCRARGNPAYGIASGQTAHPTIRDCISTDNKGSGIIVYDASKALVTNCSSTANNWTGVVIQGTSQSVLMNCTVANNLFRGILIVDSSAPAITNCQSSYNGHSGLEISGNPSPTLSGLALTGNVGQNVLVMSRIPQLLANSSLAGGTVYDVNLDSGSNLTLLNTTMSQGALVSGDARLSVKWYLAASILDRSNRPLPGAMVEGAGKNASRVAGRLSGPDGVVRDLIVTEYVQTGPSPESNLTRFGPYDFTTTKEGASNVTRNITVARSIYARFYFDYVPFIDSLPDAIVTEDRPTILDIGTHIVDRDDPPSALGITTDRDYAVPNNNTKTLLVDCPYNIGSDTVTVTVSDGLRNSTQTLNLTIIIVNDGPYCRVPIPDMVVLEDTALIINLTEYMWDEENGPYLIFACDHEEISVDNDLRKAIWEPGEGNSSLDGVIFTASDGYLSGESNSFNITFVAVNEPPVYLGGLADLSVHEHKNWSVDLDAHFRDEEDSAGMIFESSNPEVVIDGRTHVARWNPSGNASYSIEVLLTAHDAWNYSLATEPIKVTLTYIPVNDPPVYLGTLVNARLKLGDQWNVTLESHFRDEDTATLTFAVNNPNIKIIELDKTRHCAVWSPNKYSTSLQGVVFTAYDGTTHVRSPQIALTFEAPGEEAGPAWRTNILEKVPTYIYILLPIGIIGGVAAYYSFRRIKYGKYKIEQLFLVYNDGRLLAHRQRKDKPQVSNDILTGMLTALKGFVRESLKDQSMGELDEMKYGDLKIVLEQGKDVYLAAFISGYVTDRLKSEMKGVLANVQSKYEPVLRSWDGVLESFKGLDTFMDPLLVEPGAGKKNG